MANVRFLLLCCLALVKLPAAAQPAEQADCTRLRMAGLPCPSSPAAATRPVQRVPVIHGAAALAPANAAAGPARDATGATVTPAFPVPTVVPVVPGTGPPPSPPAPGLPAPMPAFATPPAPPTPQRTSVEAGQVVVYWAGTDEADAALAALAQGSRMVPLQSGRLDNLGGVLAVFQLPAQADAQAFRERLLREFPGLAVDLNVHYRPLSQPSPRIYRPQKIDAPGPNNKAVGISGVRIGLVDGPIAAIPALMLARIARKSFLGHADFAAPPDHATAIAALMTGRDANAGFTGIAAGTSLYSAEIMRAAGPDTLATSAALARAIDWLLGEKVQIINLSLGGPGDAVMARIFARLADMPVVVVAAAGNGGPAAPPPYPAAYRGVIAVTATDAADRSYSAANRGAYITLAAPGVDLWVPDEASGHYVSGTSFAAAVVTAGSAWLLAKNPYFDRHALVRRLCRDARDLGAPGPDPVFGCGLMQISASLREDHP
jgi:hypothetical protein